LTACSVTIQETILKPRSYPKVTRAGIAKITNDETASMFDFHLRAFISHVTSLCE
jgi:hypothetical protein